MTIENFEIVFALRVKSCAIDAGAFVPSQQTAAIACWRPTACERAAPFAANVTRSPPSSRSSRRRLGLSLSKAPIDRALFRRGRVYYIRRASQMPQRSGVFCMRRVDATSVRAPGFRLQATNEKA